MIDLFRMDGKVAVVIGGAGGLGEPIALGFAFYGAKVAVAGRRLENVQAVAERIQKETASEAAAFQVDASDEQSVIRLKEQVVAKFGTVDILMNAHGLSIKKPAVEFPLDIWNQQFSLNVNAFMLPCREFGKVMIAKKKGKIINMSSVRGTRATMWGGNAGYCASKGALDMFTKALASEWAPYNINVNAIAPSIVRTKLAEKAGVLAPDHLKKYLANVPLQRIGEPEDIVGLSVFLASRASDFITGQIMYLDGGLTAVG
ncbi:MAG: SDR family oxidoreductase [Dehalococcoidia bacterium]|nr:SDR family oxidoreductase [Dehalococcoidia bacterium]